VKRNARGRGRFKRKIRPWHRQKKKGGMVYRRARKGTGELKGEEIAETQGASLHKKVGRGKTDTRKRKWGSSKITAGGEKRWVVQRKKGREWKAGKGGGTKSKRKKVRCARWWHSVRRGGGVGVGPRQQKRKKGPLLWAIKRQTSQT